MMTPMIVLFKFLLVMTLPSVVVEIEKVRKNKGKPKKMI